MNRSLAIPSTLPTGNMEAYISAAFQLPVLQMLLAALGIVRAQAMLSAWRFVVVGSALAGAVLALLLLSRYHDRQLQAGGFLDRTEQTRDT